MGKGPGLLLLNTHMEPKETANFNVKGVTPGNKKLFNQLASEKGLKHHEFIEVLLKTFTTDPSKTTNPLLGTIHEGTTVADIEVLQKKIHDLQTALAATQEQLAGTSDIETLQNRVTELETQLHEAQEKVTLSEAEGRTMVKLPPHSFIYTPDPAIKRNMERAITFLIRKGKLDKTSKDLPQQFTTKAINYLINNEYPEVKK